MNLRMVCLYVVLIGGSEGKDLFVSLPVRKATATLLVGIAIEAVGYHGCSPNPMIVYTIRRI
jgi:hypothetical protein